MTAKRLNSGDNELIREAIRKSVSEPLVDMDAIAIIVARSFGVTVSCLKTPNPSFWVNQAARSAAVAMTLRYTDEPAMSILKFYGYSEQIDAKRVLVKATNRFNSTIDQVLIETGSALPPRRDLNKEEYEYHKHDSKQTKAIFMRTLLALKEWDIDNVFTHPDDFAARLNGTRFGTLERMGLIEHEQGCNEKWYRLTPAGRIAVKQYKRGVSLAEIFDPLIPRKKRVDFFEQRAVA